VSLRAFTIKHIWPYIYDLELPMTSAAEALAQWAHDFLPGPEDLALAERSLLDTMAGLEWALAAGVLAGQLPAGAVGPGATAGRGAA
jgi:hypothetical protein